MLVKALTTGLPTLWEDGDQMSREGHLVTQSLANQPTKPIPSLSNGGSRTIQSCETNGRGGELAKPDQEILTAGLLWVKPLHPILSERVY